MNNLYEEKVPSMTLFGYTLEQIEDMRKTLNYSLRHHLPNTTGPAAKFVEEDTVVLNQLDDLLENLLRENDFRDSR